MMVPNRMPDDTDERDTLPPGEDHASTVMPKAARVPDIAGRDEYFEEAKNALLNTAHRIEQYQRDLLDPEGLLSQQTSKISRLIDANYGLIHEQVRGLVHAIDSAVIRLGQVETHAAEGARRFDRIDADIMAMKAQMLSLESEVARIKTANP